MSHVIRRRAVLVECNYTAEEWQLYSDSWEHVAKELNRAVENAALVCSDHDSFVRTVRKVMETCADAGATDSEPLHLLEDIGRTLYP